MIEGERTGPLPDPVAEGLRLIDCARCEGLAVYLIGGVAVRVRTPLTLFSRDCKDIDIVASREAGRDVQRLLAGLGYAPAADFNAINGRTRMLFYDEQNSRDLDVLVGAFEMCHLLPILERARPEEATIPLADLLLTKLQIVEIGPTDILDVYNLLHGHRVVAVDAEKVAIDAGRIAELCANDWGLWRTVSGNLARIGERPKELAFDDAVWEVVAERVAQIEKAINRAKKSRRWRLRSRIGDRVQWYDEPEETH